MFTAEEVRRIVAKAIEEHERFIRAEYDRVLGERLQGILLLILLYDPCIHTSLQNNTATLKSSAKMLSAAIFNKGNFFFVLVTITVISLVVFPSPQHLPVDLHWLTDHA